MTKEKKSIYQRSLCQLFNISSLAGGGLRQMWNGGDVEVNCRSTCRINEIRLRAVLKNHLATKQGDRQIFAYSRSSNAHKNAFD